MSEPLDGAANETLNDLEQSVVEAVCRGEAVDCKRQTIRGAVLRDLIMEARPGWVLPASGIRLSRVIITDGLDLDGVMLAKPLMLWHSRIESGKSGALILRDARLKRLGIHSSTVDGDIIADRVAVENGLFLGGGLVRGRLQVRGADIGGALAIDGTEIGNGEIAIRAAGLRLSGPMILKRAKVRGEISLPRARLGGALQGQGVVVTSPKTGLDVESAHIDGDVLFANAKLDSALNLAHARINGRIAAENASIAAKDIAFAGRGLSVAQGIDLSGATLAGTLDLGNAHIDKGLVAEGMTVEGGGEAVRAGGLHVGGDFDLARAKVVGQISMAGAQIDGQFRLTEARLYGAGLAIRADGARLKGGCYLSRAIIVGALRFPAVEVGNQFRLRGASLKVDEGVALFASGAKFGRDVELNGGFQCTGAVVLDQSVIEGMIDLSSSAMVSAALGRYGMPMQAEGATAGESMALWDDRVLSLIDARVNRLHMPDSAASRPQGIIDLSRAHVGSYQDYAAAWPPASSERGTDTEGTEIDYLLLDGLTYEHLANPSGARAGTGASGNSRLHSRADDRVARQRIAWLEGQSRLDVAEHFKPQPWVQLGQRLGEQGYHDDARTVSIVRRRLELSSHSTTAGQRWQGYILDLFALYGHNPWRTVAWIAVFVVLFAGIWSWAGSHCVERHCHDETVFVVTNRDAYSQDSTQRFRDVYPAFNALGYSFDVFVPFVSFGYADHWRPNLNWRPFSQVPVPDVVVQSVTRIERVISGSREPPSRLSGEQPSQAITFTVGGVLYVLRVVQMVLGLILTSLAVTGFTGLLRSE